MPLVGQIIIGFSILLFSVLTVGFTLYEIGWKNCANKNGYALKTVCDKRVTEIKTDFKDMKIEVKKSFGQLHEKINSTNNSVAKMTGEMETQTMLLNKLIDNR